MREKYNINGNMAEDFFVNLLAFPLAIIQMQNHVDKFDPVKKNDPERPAVTKLDWAPINGDMVMSDLERRPHVNPAFEETETGNDLRF